MTQFRVACIQTCTGSDPVNNMYKMLLMINQAVVGGADFVLTPEAINFGTSNREDMMKKAQTEEKDRTVQAFSQIAKEKEIWLLAGSLILIGQDNKLFNRSILFSPNGNRVAHYDKIHLFNVNLPNGESYRESDMYQAGNRAIVANTDFGKIGLSICYDIRFPELYRSLTQSGAIFLAVPSAFTQITGQAHWHHLICTRAIETGSFIFAPAQTKINENGRHTYGHSLIVDPWGKILADAKMEEGIIYAYIDTQQVKQVREQIPVLDHIKDFTVHTV